MITGSLFTRMYFNQPLMLDKIDTVELKNCIADYIKIDEEIKDFKDIPEWDYDTVIYAEFKNNLNAGNMNNNSDLPIEKIKIKKRKKGDTTWSNVVDIPFSKNMIYTHKDKLVESLETYEYAVQGILGSTLLSEKISTVDCEFSGIWLIGKEQKYQLQFNDEISEISNNETYNVVTTLGSKYPFIIKNGNVNYRTFSVTGTLISEASDKVSIINRFEDKKLRSNINKFLNDGKPKLIKDNSGIYVLSQISNVVLTPRTDSYRYVYDISFEITEIADAYDETILRSYGLMK